MTSVNAPKLHAVNGQSDVPQRSANDGTPAGRDRAASVDCAVAGSRPVGTVINLSHCGSMKTAKLCLETPGVLAPRTAWGVA